MRKISRENLGAWLVKCDPTTWDLAGFLADGNESIEDWSVRPNYRSSELMLPGDKIAFWVSGSTAVFERGIWGLGYVVGATRDVIPSLLDPDGYWLDEDAAAKVTNYADVWIPLLDVPVTDAELRAAGVGDLEVQLVPGGSNPSWISKDQLSSVERLLPLWPNMPDVAQRVSVNSHGAGFGTPEQNAVVEDAAMRAVMDFYERDDWVTKDVSDEKLGWDVECLHPTGRTAKVEVKGVSGDLPIVLLTANELWAAERNDDWWLAIVTRALSAPTVSQFDGQAAVQAAKPYLFKADMR